MSGIKGMAAQWTSMGRDALLSNASFKGNMEQRWQETRAKDSTAEQCAQLP